MAIWVYAWTKIIISLRHSNRVASWVNSFLNHRIRCICLKILLIWFINGDFFAFLDLGWLITIHALSTISWNLISDTSIHFLQYNFRFFCNHLFLHSECEYVKVFTSLKESGRPNHFSGGNYYGYYGFSRKKFRKACSYS